MKKIIVFIVCCLLPVAYCSSQTWQWAKQGGGAGGCQEFDVGTNLAVDAAGNVYVTGYYMSHPAVFGPYSLPLQGCSDIFIAKYDSNGNILWAKKAGSPNNAPPLAGDASYGIVLDDSANVYITGIVKGSSAVFGSVSVPISASANFNFFIAKYDSAGNCLWAKSSTTTSNTSRGYSIDIGSTGLYVCGEFVGTVILGQDTLTTVANTDAFIARYDRLTGNCLWAKQANCSSSNGARGRHIIIDNGGNCYVTGIYFGTVFFDTCTLSTGADSVGRSFFLKVDTSGNCVWAKSIQGAMFLAADIFDNIYVSGIFQTSIVVDTFNLVSSGSYDIFIAKYNSYGNCLWAKTYGSIGNDNIYNTLPYKSLTVNAYSNELYLIGRTDSGFVSGSCSVPGGSFILQFDSSGNCNWNITDPSYPGGASSIAVDAGNGVYITGDILSPVTFGSTTLTPVAAADMYIAKLDASTGIQNSANVRTGFVIYPNPSDGSYTLEISQELLNSKMFICDVMGKEIFSSSLSKNKTTINIPSLTQGVYAVKLQTPDGKTFSRSIVQQ